MPIPASVLRDGFTPISEMNKNRRRLLIGTEGPSDTGKTEFALSAPGPGIVVCLDRMLDGTVDNPNPPELRQSDNFAFKVIPAPLWTQVQQPEFGTYWQLYKEWLYKAAANADVRTVVVDGDSDSWELQRLAAFGKLTQVPAILYTEVNAARRALIAKLWDSNKIIIATNKVKRVYADKIGPTGQVITGNDGKAIREWDGTSYVAQGFEDRDYLWHIWLRHLHKPAHTKVVRGVEKAVPASWGIRIMKCKPNMELIGEELWGSDCNMPALLTLVYPNVDLKVWGY